jgi:hypothetical protein
MTYAIHAWFDKHLMQRDVDTGPPVEVFLNGEAPVSVTDILFPETVGGSVYTASEWSEPDVVRSLYPDATNMTLGFQPPAEDGDAAFTTAAEAVLASVGRGRVTFRSEPVASDTLFLGMPELQLNAAVTNELTHLTATLYRERVVLDEEGAEVIEREPMNFCAIQPLVREGIDTMTPVTPGEEMTLPMQCFTMGHVVPAGQRLALEISTGTQHHASFASSGEVTVFTGPEKTRYDLPVMENAELYPDVPLLESYPVEPPPGPAQAGVEDTVVTPASTPEQRVEPVNAAGLEFDIEEGFDNAQMKVVATPAVPGDIDIFLQLQTDAGWQQTDSAASDVIGPAVDDPTVLGDHPNHYTETLESGRLPAGRWRILVYNYAGPPNSVDITVEFFNRDGESGGFGAAAEGSEGLMMTEASAGYLPQP